jgi:Carboxypeptidase regulatory-like domain/TonB-dependent Receptor Plug Domain
MKTLHPWARAIAAAITALLILVAARETAAQVYTGRIDVTVSDGTGALLPGVAVSIAGPQTQEAVTDAQGEAHFLNLAPGTYQVKAGLSGFAEYQNQAVPVTTGTSTPLRVTMSVAGVAEQVTVTADASVIDPKRQSISTNVTVEELEKIPSSRDPWVVLQTVPGVVVDRVNVGGSESGQQSNYTAKGADFGDNTWYLDGVPITDMNAIGSSPTYYDFDMFQEIQVSTGGADAQAATAGVQLNFVLRTGTNDPHGSARVFFANESLQANNIPDDLVAVAGPSGKGNRTDQYSDYGFEIGGPLMKDKWWAWGSWGKTDVRIRTINDILDRTILDNTAFKTNAQVTEAVRANFTFFQGEKKKFGRDASPLVAPESTVDQDGPTRTYKGEANWIPTANLFLTARAAYVKNAFNLEPKGGRTTQVVIDANGFQSGSSYYLETERPQKTINLDANWFSGRHEVRFGGAWRRVDDFTDFSWGGGVINVEVPDFGPGGYLSVIYRPYIQENLANYNHLYVSDTLTWDRLTLNLGLRYDHTTNSVKEGQNPAHQLVPDLLPAYVSPALDDVVTWNTLSPRIGASYALDENRRTIVRGSYASFASQLQVATAGTVAANSYGYAYYISFDTNGNGRIERPEIEPGAVGSVGIDPDNPTATVNAIDPDLKAPRSHELVFGLDREIVPNFAVSGSFTWRRFNDAIWGVAGGEPFPIIGVTSDDYFIDGRLTGNTPQTGAYDVPYYALNPEVAPVGGGTITMNRQGYHRSFKGFELSGTKRLADRWMARVGFSWNDEREYFTDPALSIQDPTPRRQAPLIDGGVVSRPTSGSGKSQVYLIVPKYQFIANGFWQGPWDVGVGANLVTRQGYGKPYYVNDVVTSDPVRTLKDVLVIDDLDANRLPAVTSFDLRFEKGIVLGRTNVVFDVDIFNLFNAATVLGRQYNVEATGDRGFDNVLEIMNPRIMRLGMRVKF